MVDNYDLLPHALEEIDLEYLGNEEVYVEGIDALKIGEAAMILGAGRATKEDVIDHAVGVVIVKKIGDKISHGDVIARVYSNGKNVYEAMDMIFEAYTISSEEVKTNNIVFKVVRGDR